MTYKIKFILISVLLICLFKTNQTLSQQNFETIIGTVDGEAVTSYELSQRIKILLNTLNLEDTIGNRDKVRSNVLQNLVDDKLKIIEAQKHEISVDDYELNNYIENIFGVKTGKLEEFKQYLISAGIDYDVLLEQAKAEILWKNLINARFSSLVVVSEDEIKKEKEKYKNNVGMLQYNYSEIVILADKNNEKEAKKKISEIKIMLDNKAGFESIAAKFSDSPSSLQNGNLGWVFADQINKETKEVLDNIRINEVSKIIKFDNGFKIIKVHSKRKYGKNYAKKLDIINFSSQFLNDEFNLFKDNINNCNENFENYSNIESLQFSKIEQVSLEDLSSEIQEEIADKKVGEKTKIFEKDNNFFFFIVCNVSGDEFQEIDEKMIDNKLYYEKVQQLSKTYLKRLNRNSNIKILIN